MLENEEIQEKVEYLGLEENKKWVSFSAKTGENLIELKELIKNVVNNKFSSKIEKNSFKEGLEKIYGN